VVIIVCAIVGVYFWIVDVVFSCFVKNVFFR